MSKEVVAVIVTIGLALAGYLATYLNARLLARRREVLDLVNAQINEFYGPLFIVHRCDRAFIRTRQRIARRCRLL